MDGKTYKVVKDPDETWGYDTRLSLAEIRELLDRKWIKPGTIFKNIVNNKCYVVINTNNELRMIMEK
jgi:hypothetical protein